MGNSSSPLDCAACCSRGPDAKGSRGPAPTFLSFAEYDGDDDVSLSDSTRPSPGAATVQLSAARQAVGGLQRDAVYCRAPSKRLTAMDASDRWQDNSTAFLWREDGVPPQSLKSSAPCSPSCRPEQLHSNEAHTDIAPKNKRGLVKRPTAGSLRRDPQTPPMHSMSAASAGIGRLPDLCFGDAGPEQLALQASPVQTLPARADAVPSAASTAMVPPATRQRVTSPPAAQRVLVAPSALVPLALGPMAVAAPTALPAPAGLAVPWELGPGRPGTSAAPEWP